MHFLILAASAMLPITDAVHDMTEALKAAAYAKIPEALSLMGMFFGGLYVVRTFKAMARAGREEARENALSQWEDENSSLAMEARAEHDPNVDDWGDAGVTLTDGRQISWESYFSDHSDWSDEDE